MTQRDATLSMYDDVLDDVKDYIDSYFHEPATTLTTFCKYAHWSRRSVQRALAYHEVTWTGLLRKARMEHAKKLLLEDMPIHMIAHRVGFSLPAQFSHAFKHFYGKSPSKYKEEVTT